MESLSRPHHRRKLSNASSFSGKNAYAGVFSGHRQKFDGAPVVNVDEYREIFGGVSSIPVLDLSNLDEASDGLNLEIGSLKPDYGLIFGGFREQDIAISYEELVARDTPRAPASTSQSSQDSGDLSQQASNDLKQFNMSYNKITQRSKDGLDGTTHVTQLHAVPGFTCFIDESTSQTNKKTENQKSFVTNNVPEKQTSQTTTTESGFNHLQDESLSNDKTFNQSHPSKVSPPPPPPPPTVSATNNESSSVTNNVHPGVDSINGDFREEPTSQCAVESKSSYSQDESLSDHKKFKTFQADFESHPSKISSSSSSSPAASANIFENHKDEKRSTATNTPEELPPSWFDEELDVNSVAAASTAALRKAIEKAQESIRIAKESVGRKKEGLRGFSSKSFKDSLKVKSRVANVSAGEGKQKQKDDKMKDRKPKNVGFSDFVDGEKLFGAKKVINEIHEKISETVKNFEVPIRPPLELSDDKMVCSPKEVVGEIRSSESIEGLELENHEKKLEDIDEINKENPGDSTENTDRKLAEELNNLTVYEEVEDEKIISQESDQNGYEKRFSETFELLENKTQDIFEQDDEKVVNEEVVEDERELEDDKEEETWEKFYDVCEVETIENSQTYDNHNLKTNEVSPKEEANHESEETLDDFHEPENYENSSTDYDDAEESESVYGASNIVFDTQEPSKVDQNDNIAEPESSQQIDDVISNSVHEFQVEDGEAIEKEMFENMSTDQMASEDNEDDNDDDDDDLDFGQNASEQSESSSDTIHCMEIEVKEYKESEETVKQEETPEMTTQMETGTPQEPADASRESEPVKVERIKEVTPEEREQERVKLAVERAIREARERAFIEVRQRVLADTREKVAKASDKISTQSRLKAERAAVERATSEARQRALEKAISQKKISEPRVQVNEIKQTSSASQPTAESALRSKAKLEKHNRIMERAAKALAEKEKRDMLALKEQAERSRLADNLDAEIKRWSTGKEGNLRALLSTLQYILGAESGWQPVSLTEIITTSAVKKAYRKATLCVHPDKLQQRGASIQQKYICEKVFDLLKAAWNRFNSEER